MHDELVASVANDWWYYNVELAPGQVTRGMQLPRVPMMPRMLLKRAELQGMECLDIGRMTPNCSFVAATITRTSRPALRI